MCADILITKYSSLEAVPLTVAPLKVHTFVAPEESTVASGSPKRHPSPSLIFPDPAEAVPKSRKPVLPGIFSSTNIFLFAPIDDDFPTIVASPVRTL